jgi:hypothetical protein
VYHDIALDRYQVAAEMSVDISISVDHKQMTGVIFRRAQAEISSTRGAAGHGKPQLTSRALDCRAKPSLDQHGSTEIAQVEGRSPDGDGLRTGSGPRPVILDRMIPRHSPDEGPDVIHEIHRAGGDAIDRVFGVKWSWPKNRKNREQPK